jgi:hypothetical protein
MVFRFLKNQGAIGQQLRSNRAFLLPNRRMASHNAELDARLKLALSNRRFSLEMAVSWICNINPARRTCWNELDRGGACHDIAFVSNDVHMVTVTMWIDKRHVSGIDVRPAFWIGSFILSYRSLCDDDQAISWVSVPTGTSSWLPYIALDIQV